MITQWIWNLFLLWKVYQFSWPWKTKSFLLITHVNGYFLFYPFPYNKEGKKKKRVINHQVTFLCLFLSCIFSTWRENMLIFLQTLHIQIKEPALKGFESFLEWFCFICLYFRDDSWLYTHFGWCLPAFFRYCLSNQITDENLNCTLYSIPGVNWIKGLVKLVNSVNVCVSTLCGWIFFTKKS